MKTTRKFEQFMELSHQSQSCYSVLQSNLRNVQNAVLEAQNTLQNAQVQLRNLEGLLQNLQIAEKSQITYQDLLSKNSCNQIEEPVQKHKASDSLIGNYYPMLKQWIDSKFSTHKYLVDYKPIHETFERFRIDSGIKNVTAVDLQNMLQEKLATRLNKLRQASKIKLEEYMFQTYKLDKNLYEKHDQEWESHCKKTLKEWISDNEEFTLIALQSLAERIGLILFNSNTPSSLGYIILLLQVFLSASNKALKRDSELRYTQNIKQLTELRFIEQEKINTTFEGTYRLDLNTTEENKVEEGTEKVAKKHSKRKH